jgi:uncharacterized PurR-regulated membrane protein YhhQ (DUF165 family)
MTESPAPAIPRSLFIFAIFYGGMVCIAGVLGVKQVAIGPLAVEAGIFAFLLLVIMASAVAELHGRATADALVRWGFLPLIGAALLIQVVLALPADQGMYPPAVEAFPIVVGQSARMMIAGLISYGLSQTLNVLIFDKLRGSGSSGDQRTAGGSPQPEIGGQSPPWGAVWLRGMIASVISQVLDTVLFISISFYGEREIWGLMGGQLTAKIVLSVVLVPPLITGFVALGKRLDAAGRGVGS